jgi:hypothetical protein
MMGIAGNCFRTAPIISTPIAVWHVEIGNNQVKAAFNQLSQPFIPILCANDFVTR